MTGFGELGIAWPLCDRVAWMGSFGAPCPFRLGLRSQYGAGPRLQIDYPPRRMLALGARSLTIRMVGTDVNNT